ncbi:hypothetical protein [Aeromonas salmonicida]
MSNTYQYAIEIATRTGKDRSNTFKTLQKLLKEIDADSIEYVEHNDDLTSIVINGVKFERTYRHWKRSAGLNIKSIDVKQVHQPIPTPEVVEEKSLIATQVKEEHVSEEIMSLAASMMSVIIPNTKPIETPKPYYVGEQQEVLDENGNPVLIGGILVEHAPDSCTDEPTKVDAKACVFTADVYKQQLIDLYLSNGYSQEDAEINANAQINAFTVVHDPELTGTYEKVSDDSFLFNGSETVVFDEDELEFQKR